MRYYSFRYSGKYILHIGGSALMTALLLYAVFHETSLSSFLDLIQGVKYEGILLYVLLSLAAICFRAIRYRWIVGAASETEQIPGLAKFVVVTAIRNTFVDLLPARLGEASFLYVLNRFGVPLTIGLTTFALCTVLDIIVLFALFVFLALAGTMTPSGQSSLHLPSDLNITQLNRGILLSCLLVIAAAVCLSIVLACLDRFLAYCGERLNNDKNCQTSEAGLSRIRSRTAAYCLEVARELRVIKERKIYTNLVLITVLLRCAKYVSLYLLLLSTVAQWGIRASDISPLIATTAFVFAESSASLPMSGIMGFGAYEGVWSLVFSFSGVALPSIQSVILVIHLITQVVGYSLGFLALAIFALWGARRER